MPQGCFRCPPAARDVVLTDRDATLLLDSLARLRLPRAALYQQLFPLESALAAEVSRYFLVPRRALTAQPLGPRIQMCRLGRRHISFRRSGSGFQPWGYRGVGPDSKRAAEDQDDDCTLARDADLCPRGPRLRARRG